MKKLVLLIALLVFAGSQKIATAQLVYKDVASIFYSRCTSCHHQNQHAPSMMNYTETVNNLGNMLSKLQNNEMPPWSPDTTYSRFVHERLISATEKNDLISWLNQGALAGDTTLAPAAPIYSSAYELKGTPTIELKTGTFVSNANTDDSYVCFSIPTGFTQDRILQAYEIVPGNVAIVHHVVVNVDTLGTTVNDLSGNCYTIYGQVGIGAYAPGAPATVFPGQFPLKTGIRVKAGSKIVMQIHYPAGTVGEIDSTKIRMFFYPVGETGVRPIYDVVPLQNWFLNLPANTVSTFTSAYPGTGGLPFNMSLFAVFPHSHKVCTKIINYAFQGTDTINMIRINDWDFEWQGFYTFKKLQKIPIGYKLFSKHIYDNTVNNPHNPFSPPQQVTAGTSTTDEMLFDGIQFLAYQPGDELINVDSLLNADPLISGVSKIETNESLDFIAFPNPVIGNLKLYFSKSTSVKIRVFNSIGTKVMELVLSGDHADVDVSNLMRGIYIFELQDINSGARATKKVILTEK